MYTFALTPPSPLEHTYFMDGPKVYVKFSGEQAGPKAMRSSNLGRQNSCVTIEICETEISIKKGSASPSIKLTQFPLTLAWGSTVHKVEGLSLEQDDTEFKKSAIKVDKDALLEYKCLKQNDWFSAIKWNAISGNTVTVLVHNVRYFQDLLMI